MTLIMENAIKLDGMPDAFFYQIVFRDVYGHGPPFNSYGCDYFGRKRKKIL